MNPTPAVSSGPARRAWVEVDTGALRRNLETIASRLRAGCGLLPMVKADGYGLGAERVVRTLAPAEPWGFGVATVPEGRALRAAGWDGRIVVFSPSPAADPGVLRGAGLEPVISGLDGLRRLAGADPPGDGWRVHLEIDTGMGRLGLLHDGASAWAPELAAVVTGARVRVETTFTHFHSAESDRVATLEQWRRFLAAVERMRAAGVSPGMLHAANSMAALGLPETRADLVRPGIYLYGGSYGEPRAEPVVRVRARVLDVRRVEAGTTVSYGATYRMPRAGRLATLGIGYGDGFRRALSNRGRVLVDGLRAPVRGRVCMDLTVVEVPEGARVRPGDVATIIGGDGEGRITLEEVADLCGTIDYEILTGWSARLPRVEV